jgi:hypothetical protein
VEIDCLFQVLSKIVEILSLLDTIFEMQPVETPKSMANLFCETNLDSQALIIPYLVFKFLDMEKY